MIENLKRFHCISFPQTRKLNEKLQVQLKISSSICSSPKLILFLESKVSTKPIKFQTNQVNFCTSKELKSSTRIDSTDLKEPSLQSKRPEVENSIPNIILRMHRYAKYLSLGSNEDKSKLEKEEFGQDLNYSLDVINGYLIQAGASREEISNNLYSLYEMLKKILQETKQRCTIHGSSSALKENPYEELKKLLDSLDKDYFKEPEINLLTPLEFCLFILSMETKMTCFVHLLVGSLNNEENPYFDFKSDITNSHPFSNEYHETWSKAHQIDFNQRTKNMHDIIYALLEKSVVLVTNAVVTEHTWGKWENLYWQKALFGLSFPVSFINLQRAELRCYRMWRNPTIKMIKNLLDLPEKGFIQHAKKVIYPKIKSNFFLYAPANKAKEGKDDEVVGKEIDPNIFEEEQNSRRILLLSHRDLIFKKLKPKKSFESFKQFFEIKRFFEEKKIPLTNNDAEFETIIIHMHGGGFISMSSELMQNHTRRWASELEVPVFSLDYRKPPLHRFPDPLNDCVSGYKFIVEKIERYLNIKPKNIILAGDSAGGNIACAMQIQLMREKYPILPKGLFLMYPAVDLRIKFTQSRLNSFKDKIFQPSLLLLCQQEYLGSDPKTQFDPLASPILLTQNYIDPSKSDTDEGDKWPRNWPPTVIMSGGKDPLYDDSIRLLERLSESKIDCKMKYYKHLSHGFMSMDQVLPGCKQAIDDSIIELKELISKI